MNSEWYNHILCALHHIMYSDSSFISSFLVQTCRSYPVSSSLVSCSHGRSALRETALYSTQTLAALRMCMCGVGCGVGYRMSVCICVHNVYVYMQLCVCAVLNAYMHIYKSACAITKQMMGLRNVTDKHLLMRVRSADLRCTTFNHLLEQIHCSSYEMSKKGSSKE